ncbi:hypothetical protein LEP1GSC059_3076 [Leptospira noguchii serovar Panama str. CZ214]|uniref:Uncharacterized protein n=1 Tax=Leptospira noguchii serovar Panama str. CZ214 TaxID=1001595 RepID=T0GUP7_9LEPT|nr:hypothetical protein LEP1GSC059_3076 [Leptospira noguchii serovar Panama str. CZ214]
MVCLISFKKIEVVEFDVKNQANQACHRQPDRILCSGQ